MLKSNQIKIFLIWLSFCLTAGFVPASAQAVKAGDCDVAFHDLQGNTIFNKSNGKSFSFSASYEKVLVTYYIDPDNFFADQRVRLEGVDTLSDRGNVFDDSLGLYAYSAELDLIHLQDQFDINLEQKLEGGDWQPYCSPAITIKVDTADDICTLAVDGYSDKIIISLAYSNFWPSYNYKFVFDGDSVIPEPYFKVPQQTGTFSYVIENHGALPGQKTLHVRRQCGVIVNDCPGRGNSCELTFEISNQPSTPGVSPPVVIPPTTPGASGTEFKACQQVGADDPIRTDDAFDICTNCYNSGGIWTGIGCIPFTNTAGTVKALLTIGLGLAGMTVVVMSLAAGFLMSTSQGDLKRVDEAKALITSAISGILFIVFSVTILRFVGIVILQLPGFG